MCLFKPQNEPHVQPDGYSWGFYLAVLVDMPYSLETVLTVCNSMLVPSFVDPYTKECKLRHRVQVKGKNIFPSAFYVTHYH